MLRLALTLVAVLCVALPVPADAQRSDAASRRVGSDARRDETRLVDGDDVRTFLEFARSFGTANMDRSDRGDPAISGEMRKLKYSVLFTGCSRGRDCKYVQFIASFVLPKSYGDRDMNDWNKTRLFGKAFINDKNEAVISMNATLVGGVSRDNVNDMFAQYRTFLAEFSDFLYGKRR
jgi:hypothetical protein